MTSVPTLSGAAPTADVLAPVLERAAASHHHLCPRQVLGARAGLAGAAWLDLDVPRDDKHMLTIVETDGCFVSGVEAATGTHVGRRTLRVEDLGRIAATFVDVKRERAVRVCPRPGARERALELCPDEPRRWFAMRDGYQRMADDELLVAQPVALTRSLREIVSRPHVRALCAVCGEEIINEREVVRDERTLCRVCDGGGYYRAI